MGRTRAKRLRGYGNAIVLPLAVAFVESVIEAFVDAAVAHGVRPSTADRPPIVVDSTADVERQESAA